MDPLAAGVLSNLLEYLKLEEVGARIAIRGRDPVVPSRYRAGLASAVSLAAQAAGIEAIWRMRGGREQSIDIDLGRAAVPGLRTVAHVLRDGRRLQLKRPQSESQVFFRTKDGRQFYLLRHAFYHEHFTKLLTLLDCAPATEAIARAVAKWNATELEEAAAAHKVMGTIARTRDEWLASPQGRHLAPRIPIEVERIGDGATVPLLPADRPLEGVRVIDMAHVLAGPVASRVLAEQGAEVLHVSAPQHPDPTHIVLDTGFGKRSAFVDLDSADDVRSLQRLIDGADVFAHSWRPGSLDRRGLSPAELARRRPGIIYASVSCYGYDGPWATRAGYDPLGQVASGLAVGEGSVDEPRLASTFTLNDYLAGYLAAAGVNAALIRRAKEGGSYHVKVSLTGCSMWLQGLGELPKAQWPDGPDGIAELPQPLPAHLMRSATVFGEIEHPSPIVQYSETAARWTRAPEPAGASPAAWADD